MVSLFLGRLQAKIWPEPLPSPGSFEGQTVLVTGATAGLGLAAAVHFARLGARVILTSRTAARGDCARQHVEDAAGIAGQGKVHVVELDMTRYSSCVSFLGRLKQNDAAKSGLDVAVLNAGVINADYVRSPEGWEEAIQVNTLSTTLLGLLLLPWMKQTGLGREKIPHLVFVTSRDHLDPDITTWAEWPEAHGGILRHLSDAENWPSDYLQPNYAASKLMLTYAVEEISKRATGQDGTLQVIVNSVCPGLVSTDLPRSLVQRSWRVRALVFIYLGCLGKSADYGARLYVRAALTPREDHGKYIQSLFSDEEYRRVAIPNLKSQTAIKVKAQVWNEILGDLLQKVPALEDLR
ncbi:putative short chain dehydrogenase/ reductase [Cryphonectria parasitica EP155]|uniref:Short chain dehydrogenase/ reductase n=1 Tax=Cryphonectria parasitica (strain ATCC 38755 / EP155) TaxID=660469 RepID=A0A9P5CMH0_CRYP1|nr:putative short chain dehydrogenase/ reductase [Cryphonectria parasitica EP155]KAF3764374.1 putative short chain dehydrogenase/ reductase [Cryphonectria parasitica EP155]